MAYTNSPTVNLIDEVRLLIGDTDEMNEFLTDEEISYYIVKRGQGLPAAVGCARGLQAKFSKLADETAGDVEVKWAQRARLAASLADALTQQMNGTDGSATPDLVWAGGISVSDMAARKADTDNVPSKFTMGMMGQF